MPARRNVSMIYQTGAESIKTKEISEPNSKIATRKASPVGS